MISRAWAAPNAALAMSERFVMMDTWAAQAIAHSVNGELRHVRDLVHHMSSRTGLSADSCAVDDCAPAARSLVRPLYFAPGSDSMRLILIEEICAGVFPALFRYLLALNYMYSGLPTRFDLLANDLSAHPPPVDSPYSVLASAQAFADADRSLEADDLLRRFSGTLTDAAAQPFLRSGFDHSTFHLAAALGRTFSEVHICRAIHDPTQYSPFGHVWWHVQFGAPVDYLRRTLPDERSFLASNPPRNIQEWVDLSHFALQHYLIHDDGLIGAKLLVRLRDLHDQTLSGDRGPLAGLAQQTNAIIGISLGLECPDLDIGRGMRPSRLPGGSRLEVSRLSMLRDAAVARLEHQRGKECQ